MQPTRTWLAVALAIGPLTAGLASTIVIAGAVNERTEAFNPNLRDVHAMVLAKGFSVLYTVNWYDDDEPSQVIAYDPRHATPNHTYASTGGSPAEHQSHARSCSSCTVLWPTWRRASS